MSYEYQNIFSSLFRIVEDVFNFGTTPVDCIRNDVTDQIVDAVSFYFRFASCGGGKRGSRSEKGSMKM